MMITVPIVYGQNYEPPHKSKAFSIRMGGVYYGVRDHNSSTLFYEGLGGLRLGITCQKSKNDVLLNDFQMNIEYGEVGKKSNMGEDIISIYSLSGAYTKLRKYGSAKHPKINYFLGGSASIRALYLVYPFIFANNGDTYSMDLLSLNSKAGVSFSLNKDHNKFPQSTLKLFTQIGIIGLNLRAQNYSGVSPENVFEEMRFTNIGNNLTLQNSIEYVYLGKKQQLGLIYQWEFMNNSSTPNRISFAQHHLAFRYTFPNHK